VPQYVVQPMLVPIRQKTMNQHEAFFELVDGKNMGEEGTKPGEILYLIRAQDICKICLEGNGQVFF